MTELRSKKFSVVFFVDQYVDKYLTTTGEESFAGFEVRELPSLGSIVGSNSGLCHVSRASMGDRLMPHRTTFS